MQAFSGMEAAGEVLVHLLGLDQSKYQWAINELEREQEMQREKEEVRLCCCRRARHT